MDENDFERIAKTIDDSRGSTLTAMKDMLEEANRPIKEQLGNLERATDHISVECDANKKSIEGLKAQMTGLKDSIKEELKSEMRTELGASKDAAHRLNVEKEIDKVAGNIIIHGLKPHTAEDVATLLESLNFPSEVKTGVKRVVPLGRGDNVKSILVELSDPASRNPLLGNIDFKKLPRGVRIERDVPLAFREEYQKFSSEAHKLRKFCDFQTRIIFVGHEMQLKYKEKGLPSKGYVIHKTFSPSPSNTASPPSSNPSNNKRPATAPTCPSWTPCSPRCNSGPSTGSCSREQFRLPPRRVPGHRRVRHPGREPHHGRPEGGLLPRPLRAGGNRALAVSTRFVASHAV